MPAALLLGIINAVVSTAGHRFTLPLTLMTLGPFLLLVNTGMLSLVAWLLDGVSISGFWTALGASIFVTSFSGWPPA